jgi:CBS domain-containing protein
MADLPLTAEGVECGCSALAAIAVGTGATEATGACVPAVAASLPVGLALAGTVFCVEKDASLRVALSAVPGQEREWGVPVVDRLGILVGHWSPSEPNLATFDATVGEHMSPPTRAVYESETLGDAFAMMTARRLRGVVVLGERGEVVGVLRDVDALHFVAHVARTGLRPALE